VVAGTSLIGVLFSRMGHGSRIARDEREISVALYVLTYSAFERRGERDNRECGLRSAIAFEQRLAEAEAKWMLQQSGMPRGRGRRDYRPKAPTPARSP